MSDHNGYRPTKPLHGLPTRPATIIPIASRDRDQMPGFPPSVAAEIMRFLNEGATGNIAINVTNGEIRGCQTTRFVRAVSLDHNRKITEDSID